MECNINLSNNNYRRIMSLDSLRNRNTYRETTANNKKLYRTTSRNGTKYILLRYLLKEIVAIRA